MRMKMKKSKKVNVSEIPLPPEGESFEIPERKLIPAEEKFSRKFELFCFLPEFRKEVWNIREKWKIPKNGLGNSIKSNEFKKNLKRKNEEQEFESDICKLAEKFNLTKEKWNQNLWFLIVEGHLITSPLIKYPILKQTFNEATNQFELWVRIFGNDNIEDVKSVWSKIEKYQEILPEYKPRSREMSKENLNRLVKFFALQEKKIFPGFIQRKNGEYVRYRRNDLQKENEIDRIKYLCRFLMDTKTAGGGNYSYTYKLLKRFKKFLVGEKPSQKRIETTKRLLSR